MYPTITYASLPTAPLKKNPRLRRGSARPNTSSDKEGAGAADGGTAVLRELLFQLFSGKHSHQNMKKPDASGAPPILALLVANSQLAIELGLRIYEVCAHARAACVSRSGAAAGWRPYRCDPP